MPLTSCRLIPVKRGLCLSLVFLLWQRLRPLVTQDLSNQLVDLLSHLAQRLLAQGRCTVVLADFPTHQLVLSHQIARFLQAVQQGVQRAWRKMVTVARRPLSI